MKDKENRSSQEIIICGDIHGRTHWKNGLDYFNTHPDCKMIFLGDYLDPYTRYDGVTHEDAYNNFIEILEFAKSNPLRVILLEGNHDQVLRDERRESCRHDYYNMYRNRKLFQDNIDLFKFAHKEDNYLFTHAGVCEEWLKQNNLEKITEHNIVDYLNSNPKTLWQIGASRGGRGYASPLWACWEGDWPYCNNPFNLIQCFGHTNEGKNEKPFSIKEKRIYMFDVHNCFLLDTKTGEINLLS